MFSMPYYPIAIDLTGQRCLVVGGGEVALRKAQALREAGAPVTVIAAQPDARLEGIDGVEIVRRNYGSGDVSGYALVFSATDDREVNASVSRECREQGISVNVVDDPELCSFIVPAMLRRGELLIAIWTGGMSPSLSKRIRKELQQRYGPEYGEFVELLGELRDQVKVEYASYDERQAVFSQLLDCGILELIREGKPEEARERAKECIWP